MTDTYEFDIVETRVARDDDSDKNNPDHPDFEPEWQLAAGTMTAQSRDGWELVSVNLEVNKGPSTDGNPRTESVALSVWRRPIDS